MIAVPIVREIPGWWVIATHESDRAGAKRVADLLVDVMAALPNWDAEAIFAHWRVGERSSFEVRLCDSKEWEEWVGVESITSATWAFVLHPGRQVFLHAPLFLRFPDRVVCDSFGHEFAHILAKAHGLTFNTSAACEADAKATAERWGYAPYSRINWIKENVKPKTNTSTRGRYARV